MASKFKPYEQTTITGIIREGKRLAISESSMSFKAVADDCAIQYYNVITKYIDTLGRYITTVTLTDDEMFLYKQKPNLYCYTVYGTPELASSLLYINNMVSVKDFKKNTFKAFTSNIMDAVKELMSLNERDLINNRVECGID